MAIERVYRVIVIWKNILWNAFILVIIIALIPILLHVIPHKIRHHLPTFVQSMLVTNELFVFIL